ncbi:MAG: energy transducer TonB [Gammaproteobacteria bacterium]|nr:energy transducer TonB [Gammaproteobacteria bacterium]
MIRRINFQPNLGCFSALILGLAIPVISSAAEQQATDLRARATLAGTAGDIRSTVTLRLDHPRAQAIKNRLTQNGITESDVLRLALEKFGSVATVVKYQTRIPKGNSAEKRQEALEIFGAIAEVVDARRTPFVLLDAASASDIRSQTSQTSYDYTFWQDTQFNWRLITADPDDYFRHKIDAATSATSASDLAYWHLSLGAIERASGRNRRAERRFEKTFDLSEDIVPGPFRLRLRAAAALAALAASRDGDAFKRYCGAYALALGDYTIPQTGYLPLIRFRPEYPRSARTQKIEGYVVAEFTVTEACRPKDIEVVESEPPHVFDAAAVETLRRFRFLPAVKGGSLVKSDGIRYTVQFRIDRSQPRARRR